MTGELRPLVGQVERQVRRSPSGVIHSRSDPASPAVTGERTNSIARQQTLDLASSLLGLERAGAVDQRAARLHEPRGVVEQARLQVRQRGHVVGALQA